MRSFPQTPPAALLIECDCRSVGRDHGEMGRRDATRGDLLLPMTLGLVVRDELAARLGRNAAFDRAGNLFIAAVAAAVGTAWDQRAVFYLVPFFGVWTVWIVLAIPSHAIDHQRARGWEPSMTVVNTNLVAGARS